MRRWLLLTGLCAVLMIAVIAPGLGQAQQEPPPSDSGVVGVDDIAHSVADIDKTVAFYREVFGLEMEREIRRNFNDPGPQRLTNAPGANLDMAWLKVPGGLILELVEFKGVGRKTLAPPRQTDPGAAELNLRVRDMKPILAALRKAGAPVITLGGEPIRFNRNGTETSRILVRDPDGFILEVTEAPAPQGAPSSNVYDGAIGITIGDSEKSLRFYRDLLGFPIATGEWIDDKNTMRMIGMESGQIRISRAAIPGSDIRCEFYEHKGVQQTRFEPRLQDPGAPYITLTVRDINRVFNRLKNAGAPVVTAGGQPVNMNGRQFVMLRDPNGLIVELVQPR